MYNRNKSYIKNYIKTYFWHGSSLLLNIGAMLVVIPLLTDNKPIFGIYSLCVSFSIFLNYIDFGFFTAGVKYAGEHYARGDVNKEIEHIGFSTFILLVFTLLVAGIFFMMSQNPAIIFNESLTPIQSITAKKLLLIQSIFSINIILYKLVSSFFQIRIEQYKLQRISIIGVIGKLMVALLFFQNANYNIVGYYLSIKLIDTLVYVVGFLIIKTNFGISPITIIKHIRYNRKIFLKTRKLAVNSLFVVVFWILYNEMDLLVIGRFGGPESVAIYAVGYTLIKYIRSITGIFFSPFQNRFNHFIGINNVYGLNSLLKNIIITSAPLFIYSVISIIILRKNIISTWVGTDYGQADTILALLTVNYLFAYITTPTSNLLVSTEKLKIIYFISLLSLVVYWGGVLLSYKILGILSFALFKMVSGLVSSLIYIGYLYTYLKININRIISKYIIVISIPLIIQVLILMYSQSYLSNKESLIGLLFTICVGVTSVIIALTILYNISRIYNSTYAKYKNKLSFNN